MCGTSDQLLQSHVLFLGICSPSSLTKSSEPAPTNSPRSFLNFGMFCSSCFDKKNLVLGRLNARQNIYKLQIFQIMLIGFTYLTFLHIYNFICNYKMLLFYHILTLGEDLKFLFLCYFKRLHNQHLQHIEFVALKNI